MKMNIVNFELKPGIPRYKQVYDCFKNNILNGYLKKEDQLPSIRQAVQIFHVSKTSVERAYEQLMSDGWIKSIPQVGMFVDMDPKRIAMRKEIFRHPSNIEQQKVRYDFRSQSMDNDSFDLQLWKKYLKEALDHQQSILTYGDAQGEKSLRIALRDYAISMRGVLCKEEQIVVGASFQSLLYLLCGVLKRKVRFGMEGEGFSPFESVCEDYGIEVCKLTMNEEGFDFEQLYESNLDLLYINSVSCGVNHQPITMKQRKQLLTWAKEKNTWILEDDHNGELRYRSKMTPAIQGFDEDNHSIYIGSFSRLLLPSLRISYMVLPQALNSQFQARKESYSPTASKIEQLALTNYIMDGHLLRHVKRLKKRYSVKSQTMENLLRQYFPSADIYLEESALRFIVRLPIDYEDEKLMELSKVRRIYITISKKHELILSFAAIPLEEMEKAIKELQELVQECILYKNGDELITKREYSERKKG